uniref:Uncharacterized protein n=1 Tax=Ananas comosus var. bracteatus TaxID=296719 RepID=A0A6V7P5A7_ANACO|nr:unnamed protein product [Ananas comosus var. bracteatus]
MHPCKNVVKVNATYGYLGLGNQIPEDSEFLVIFRTFEIGCLGAQRCCRWADSILYLTWGHSNLLKEHLNRFWAMNPDAREDLVFDPGRRTSRFEAQDKGRRLQTKEKGERLVDGDKAVLEMLKCHDEFGVIMLYEFPLNEGENGIDGTGEGVPLLLNQNMPRIMSKEQIDYQPIDDLGSMSSSDEDGPSWTKYSMFKQKDLERTEVKLGMNFALAAEFRTLLRNYAILIGYGFTTSSRIANKYLEQLRDDSILGTSAMRKTMRRELCIDADMLLVLLVEMKIIKIFPIAVAIVEVELKNSRLISGLSYLIDKRVR